MKFLSKPVWAWALWDLGTSSISAVVITFVFATYLTSSLFPPDSAEILGWVLAVVGVLVALVAPVIGLSSDRSGYHASWLRASTGLSVILTLALYFVKPGQIILGTVFLAFLTLLNEIAQVHYNAMLPSICKKDEMSQVSAFGWGLGYLGTIFSLGLVLVLFILDSTRLSFIPDTDGLPVRGAMLFVGIWVLVWCIPIMVTARDNNTIARLDTIPIHKMYGELWRSIRRLWKTYPAVILFVVASALFRDGLNGVFALAGVLAQGAFGFTSDEIIYFAIVANLVAGVVTVISGRLDSVIGSMRVIKLSLILIIILALGIFFFHSGGKPVFWGLGLAMSALVGPAQASSRSYLAQIMPEGQEAEVFGLYATTGRAVSFLSPAMWALFLVIGRNIKGHTAMEWGILGITIVLVIGLLSMKVMDFAPKPDDPAPAS